MTMFEQGTTRLHYELEGVADGFPVLLLAPGGMHSANEIWNRMPWNPRTALADRYRLIGMDQRNAGQSIAPVDASDGWGTYAADHLALLDHLGIEQCHVVGMCIGGPFIVRLLVEAPKRFRSAVVLQAAGVEVGNGILRELFDQWADALAPAHPEATPADWASFGSAMWDGDFVLSASRSEVAAIATPMLVMMGDDQYHPQSVSRELAGLVPNGVLVEHWKEPDVLASTDATIGAFLADHTH